MNERKLVQHGPATLMVSLPAKWLKKNDLSKGNEISIEEKGKELILKTNKEKSKKVIELTLTSNIESSVRAVLKNLYRLGYDKITLKYSNPKVLDTITKETKKNLIGFEIIKRDNNKCIIENILEPSKDQFENIQSKLFLNIDELFNSFKELSKSKNLDLEAIEDQIQSFDSFCRRVIGIESEDISKLKLDFQTAIYHAQRELYFALKIQSESKVISKSTSVLVEKTQELFDLIKTSLKSKEFKILEKIHGLEKEIILNKGYDSLKKSSKPEEKIILHRVLSSARNFYLASSPLMGLLILESK